MLKFAKRSDLNRMFRQMISTDYLVQSVFEDDPELDNFVFNCTSEYDDSNYSDHVVLETVNGHRVDYNGRYDDDEDFDEYDYKPEDYQTDLPRVHQSTVDNIVYLVGEIGHDYGYDEHTVSRSDVLGRKRRSQVESDGLRYLKSYISKTEIESEWFLKHDPKWACYYAEDHGRFSKEVELALFCKQGHMREAFMYAQAIKKSLPKAIENFFVTHNLLGSEHNDDKSWLKMYLKFKDSLNKSKVK